jgi:hypothetical protein
VARFVPTRRSPEAVVAEVIGGLPGVQLIEILDDGRLLVDMAAGASDLPLAGADGWSAAPEVSYPLPGLARFKIDPQG